MRIVKNGDVHVSAPIGMPKKEVERFIEEQICKMEEDENDDCDKRSDKGASIRYCPADNDGYDR